MKLTLQLVGGNPIKAIALPALAEIQNDPERLRAGIIKSLNITSAICCPIFFGVSAVAQEAVTLVFGDNWSVSIPVLQWLSLSGLAMMILMLNDNVFILKNRTTFCLWVSLSYAVLAVVIVLIFSKLGIRLLAPPFVLPYVIVLPLSTVLMSRLVKLPLSAVVGAVFPGLSAAVLMFGVVLAAREFLPDYSNTIHLAMLSGIGMLTYAAVLSVFWRPTAVLLLDILKRFRKRKTFVTLAS